MQIDIRLTPFYDKSFGENFPKLAELLDRIPYGEHRKRELSLYEMIDVLHGGLYEDTFPNDLKQRLKPLLEHLWLLKKSARDHLLARRLNELDQILYQIEDQFEELERSL